MGRALSVRREDRRPLLTSVNRAFFDDARISLYSWEYVKARKQQYTFYRKEMLSNNKCTIYELGEICAFQKSSMFYDEGTPKSYRLLQKESRTHPRLSTFSHNFHEIWRQGKQPKRSPVPKVSFHFHLFHQPPRINSAS